MRFGTETLAIELGISRHCDRVLVFGAARQHWLQTECEVAADVTNKIVENSSAKPSRIVLKSGVHRIVQHHPTIDAMQYLVDDIWSLHSSDCRICDCISPVRPLPAPWTAWQNSSGRVRSVDELMPLRDSGSATIARLQFGDGVKGNTSNSPAAIVPVTTSSCATEGAGRLLLASQTYWLSQQTLTMETLANC